jgi:DNA polymerase III subunit epsilon
VIHQLLNLKRPLFVIDCETTGTDPQKDRIVELGFQQWGAEGMTKEWRSLVNPGVPIPEEAAMIHGIRDAVVYGCSICGRLGVVQPRLGHELRIDADQMVHEFAPWPTFAQLAPNLAGGLRDCDFAGQNVRFDLRMLAAEFARAGIEWSYLGARIVDSSQLERLAVPRSLSHLHKKYVGHAHDGAHGALSDVRAAATVIVKQLQEHQTLPRDLDLLHRAQWPDEWLDGDGKFRLVNGVGTCTFGKWRGRAMRDIEGSYWDWLIGADFPADVKALARDAKLGKFPEAK